MITKQQVEVLRGRERHFRELASCVEYDKAAEAYAETADALAAAIATIEGLPRTKDGVHVGDGDSVWTWQIRPWGYAVRTTAFGAWNRETNISKAYSTAEKAVAAAAARGEVEGG